MEKFCSKCGNKVAEDVMFCPSCGAPLDKGNNQPQGQPQQQYTANQYASYNTPKKAKTEEELVRLNTLALILSSTGITISIIGGIMYGLFMTIPGLGVGIAGLVLAIFVSKESKQKKGVAALVLGVVAVLCSLLFTLGCSTFKGQRNGCYGISGASCKASCKSDNSYSDYDNFFN